MRSGAKCYDELRAHVDTLRLVDCHDHTGASLPCYRDPIGVVATGYFVSDLVSAGGDRDAAAMQDSSVDWRQRWPVLERAWKRTCHTGYAQVVRRVLKRFYGVDELTLAGLESMEDRLLDISTREAQDAILEEAGIAARLEDVWPSTRAVLDGALELSARARLVISLPAYHNICSYGAVQERVSALDRTVTSLGEYLEACGEIFGGCKEAGAVAFKDQSAYSRTLAYDNPSRAEAEAVFNWFMADPRRSAAYPDGIKPLDDYLFHCFMRMARDLDLPVQIHTGHMAGVRNDIVKTNAAGLRSVLELHRDVQFDLFHANWPYSGDLLYLCKNYPNVAIDFCWANIIDPIYCQRMFQQALSTVPHAKIHGYGSDFGGQVDHAWAHASIARDNIAIALSELVEMGYLGLDDAREVAQRWLFDNANEFFRLGL